MTTETTGGVARCSGHCCRSLRSLTPITGALASRGLDIDGFTIATMVKPLGHFAVGAMLPDGGVSEGGYYYDCRHLRPNGDCAIYENRPQMCREYPKSGRCNKAGCTDACATACA